MVEEEEVIEGDDALLTNTPAKPNQNSVTPDRGDAGAAETPVQRAKREAEEEAARRIEERIAQLGKKK